MGFPQVLVLTGVSVGGAVLPSVPQPKGWLWRGGTGRDGVGWVVAVVSLGGFLCHIKVEALTLSLHLIFDDVRPGRWPQCPGGGRGAGSSCGQLGWLFPGAGGNASNKVCSNNVCFDGRGSRGSGPGGNNPAPSGGSVQRGIGGVVVSLCLGMPKEESPGMWEVGAAVNPREQPPPKRRG